jgi:hypothetical protein
MARAPYTNDYVFPLRNVYEFARTIGGEFAHLIGAIERWKYPKSLESSRFGGTSQIRRLLCYQALKKFELWDQFVHEHWPSANSADGLTSITELDDEFIHSGRLAGNTTGLPPEAQDLIP